MIDCFFPRFGMVGWITEQCLILHYSMAVESTNPEKRRVAAAFHRDLLGLLEIVGCTFYSCIEVSC